MSNTASDLMQQLLNAPVTFGIRHHVPAIYRMLKEGKTWKEIAAVIGWESKTAQEYYERALPSYIPVCPEGWETLKLGNNNIYWLNKDGIVTAQHEVGPMWSGLTESLKMYFSATELVELQEGSALPIKGHHILAWIQDTALWNPKPV